MKICRKCHIEKELESFGGRAASRDGLKSWCKPCESMASRERRNADPEKAKDIAKKSRKKHAAKRNKNSVLWREKNKERMKQTQAEYRKRPEVKAARRAEAEKKRRENCVPVRSKMPRSERLEKANIAAKAYYKANKDKIREYKKTWIREKIATDPQFKLTHRLRTRVYNAVKGTVKSATTIELIGCEVEHLMEHLAESFTPGMSWDNYGDWHVDHIIPCAEFDLTKEAEQRACFNYRNLQPLWAFDNMSKGARLNHTSQRDAHHHKAAPFLR